MATLTPAVVVHSRYKILTAHYTHQDDEGEAASRRILTIVPLEDAQALKDLVEDFLQKRACKSLDTPTLPWPLKMLIPKNTTHVTLEHASLAYVPRGQKNDKHRLH